MVVWDLAGAGHIPTVGVVHRVTDGAHPHAAGILWVDGIKAVRAAVLFLGVDLDTGVG